MDMAKGDRVEGQPRDQTPNAEPHESETNLQGNMQTAEQESSAAEEPPAEEETEDEKPLAKPVMTKPFVTKPVMKKPAKWFEDEVEEASGKKHVAFASAERARFLGARCVRLGGGWRSCVRLDGGGRWG